MTLSLLLILLVAVIVYIIWILAKSEGNGPSKKVLPKKMDPINNPTLTKVTTELKQKTQTSRVDQARKKIAEQLKKDPEMISRALRYWLDQK
tara:strand:- start:186 stop:461 length:276 start_codon:yes stop_codon:yes gene_type:complete